MAAACWVCPSCATTGASAAPSACGSNTPSGRISGFSGQASGGASAPAAFFRSALVCGGWQQRVDQHRLAVLRHTIFGIVHTDPRLPGEGHGQCGGESAVLVDPAGAGIEPLGQRQPAIDVTRPDGAAETVGTAIRLSYRLRLLAEGDDREHRAELILNRS